MSREAVVCDLDGTLADVAHLSEYILGVNTNYDKFHELVESAEPIDWVVWDLRRWESTHDIIIVTARQDKFWGPTIDWITDNEIPCHELHMRTTGDLRSDYEVKKDILDYRLADVKIDMAYDDNPSTVKLWLERGIPTTVVPGFPVRESV